MKFLCYNCNETYTPSINHDTNKNNIIEIFLHNKTLYFCSFNCYKSFRINYNANNPPHIAIEKLYILLEHEELSKMFDQFMNVKNKNYDNKIDDEDCNYDYSDEGYDSY